MSLSNHRRSVALTRNLICALTALAIATASCSSMHQVPLVRTSADQPVAWQVKAGDTVRVTFRDGGSSEFKVQSVTPDAIIASGGARYENAEIISMERRGFSAGKTTGAALAGAGLAAIALAAIGMAALFSLLSGGG